MEISQTNKHTVVATKAELIDQVSFEHNFNNAQVQPLSALIEEIINFQLEERALFTNFETTSYFLN